MNSVWKNYKVIPLLHPRQADELGKNTLNWKEHHMSWYHRKSFLLIKGYNKILKEFRLLPVICRICLGM